MSKKNLSVREAIRERRSIKNLNGTPVEEEVVLDVLKDAVWAPNHGHRNPWRFVVAAGDDYPKLLELLKETAIPNWESLDEETLEKQMKRFSGAGAAVFVIVPEDARQKERLEDFAAASALVQNAQLIAWDEGVGTCWKTPPFLDSPKFRERLGVKPGERIISMLQFGYYDKEPKARERTPLDELVTRFE